MMNSSIYHHNDIMCESRIIYRVVYSSSFANSDSNKFLLSSQDRINYLSNSGFVFCEFDLSLYGCFGIFWLAKSTYQLD